MAPDAPMQSSFDDAATARQWRLIRALQRHVEASADWSWLALSCSLARGCGDELSDVDVGVGHRIDSPDDLVHQATKLVESLGTVTDVLVHAESDWPPLVHRLAVEYDSGLQLDLVVMPADLRPGMAEGELALVDKEGHLATVWTPPAATADAARVREWMMLAWWALSDVAKYVRRQSLFEAVEALSRARTEMLRVFAVSQQVPYPGFGLTSLLDFEPFHVPDRLAATYADPENRTSIVAAAFVVADLLDAAARDSSAVLGMDLCTEWAATARGRLRGSLSQHRGSLPQYPGLLPQYDFKID